MSLPIILTIVSACILFFAWSVYNALATGKVRIQEALSSIDVQLKRRIELIPNLIETVKGYAKHEKDLLTDLTRARTALTKANTLRDKATADNMLSSTLKSLFAVSENYPNLKANENFLQLQEELSDTENKIAYARQFYNSVVREFNSTLVSFPSGTIGGMFGFREAEFFEADEEERKPVRVSF